MRQFNIHPKQQGISNDQVSDNGLKKKKGGRTIFCPDQQLGAFPYFRCLCNDTVFLEKQLLTCWYYSRDYNSDPFFSFAVRLPWWKNSLSPLLLLLATLAQDGQAAEGQEGQCDRFGHKGDDAGLVDA